MADIEITSNSAPLNKIPGGDSTNSLSGERFHTTNEHSSLLQESHNEHSTIEQVDLAELNSENEEESLSDSSQPLPCSSKEFLKEEPSGDNHSVWLPSAIKSEIEEPDEKDTGFEEDDSEYEKSKEEKMEEESNSNDDVESEGGAYHLAEVSYGEEDEKDSEKREGGESESILGISHDFSTHFIHDGIRVNRVDIMMESKSPVAGRFLTYLCKVCTRRALGKDVFLEHVQQHAGLFKKHERRPYRRMKHPDKVYLDCVICEYKSNSKDSLTKHLIESHPLEFSYSCPNCEFITNKFLRLRTHMGNHHNVYACNECEYKTERYTYLKEHFRIHTKEKPFACNDCSFRCSSKNSLGKHMRVHTGETPYCCKLCDKKFKQSGHLTEHMRQHTGEKPFQCHICDYRCAYRGLINKHIKTHSTEKPFPCTVCEFRGKTQYTLNTHMRLHTGERIYKCEHCTFSCNSRSGYLDHQYKHNGKLPPFNCDMCSARFIRERFLKRHIAAHKKKPQGVSCRQCGKLFLSPKKLYEHKKTHSTQS